MSSQRPPGRIRGLRSKKNARSATPMQSTATTTMMIAFGCQVRTEPGAAGKTTDGGQRVPLAAPTRPESLERFQRLVLPAEDVGTRQRRVKGVQRPLPPPVESIGYQDPLHAPVSTVVAGQGYALFGGELASRQEVVEIVPHDQENPVPPTDELAP